MYEQDYLIEKNESNTATKEASIRDKADPVTTSWLILTCTSLRNSGDYRETAIYSFVKSILTNYCEKLWCWLEEGVGVLKVSHSPTRPYRQIFLYRQHWWCTDLGGITGYYCTVKVDFSHRPKSALYQGSTLY